MDERAGGAEGLSAPGLTAKNGFHFLRTDILHPVRQNAGCPRGGAGKWFSFHARHTYPIPNPARQKTNSYGANSYGANSYGANSYGANSYGANSYGANSYGANSYGVSWCHRMGYDLHISRADLWAEDKGKTWRFVTGDPAAIKRNLPGLLREGMNLPVLPCPPTLELGQVPKK
jgi:hypothetical protein